MEYREEYVLQMEYDGKQLPLRGYFVRSTLKEWKQDDQGTKIPIYNAGMKLTSSSNEIREILKLIGQGLRRVEINEHLSSSFDEDDDQGKDTKHLESFTHI